MTQAEHFHSPQEPESYREDLGYDRPYDPRSITDEQARVLYDQGLGGYDVARRVVRDQDVAFIDTSLGYPEGTKDVVKTPEASLVAAENWQARSAGVTQDLQAELDAALERNDGSAPLLRAKLERRLKLNKNISSRIKNLSE